MKWSNIATMSGNHQFSAKLKKLRNTQDGRNFIFEQFPKELCQSWKTETLSAPGQNQTSASKNIINVQPLDGSNFALSTSFQSSSTSEEDSSSDSEDSDEEIINFRPANQKPNFKFEPSALGASLPSFLAALKSSNDGLAAGVPDDQKFEISDSDSDEEHIEMNLGLGVLEETSAGLDTPVSISSKRELSSDGDNDDDDDENELTPYNPIDGVSKDVASPSKKLKLLG
ncbi:hypothetical protein M7I_4069 [Glarea lozoyensis 74030]|uniref:Uncharacterized protein n=1 Tax=Glarea lozoyensis (strain ATCC 74030 / MF5533) TaxID=1104152 RepID=H0EN66_GLAL7|nr:hypothetical protein M7I_4069 [Glarea lozoyensis 74030]